VAVVLAGERGGEREALIVKDAFSAEISGGAALEAVASEGEAGVLKRAFEQAAAWQAGIEVKSDGGAFGAVGAPGKACAACEFARGE